MQTFKAQQASQKRIDDRNKRNRESLATALNVPVADAQRAADSLAFHGQPPNALGLARLHAVSMVQTLHDIATDADQPAAARVSAAANILGHALPKADGVTVGVQVNTGQALDALSTDELRERVRLLREEVALLAAKEQASANGGPT